MRLNKFIAQSGYCSLRIAEKLIEEGHVTVNDRICKQNIEIKDNPIVKVKNQTITNVALTKKYYAFNKPIGLVCTEDEQETNNIISYLNFNERVFSVGRLDKDSEGLLLLTNDGDFANKIIHSSFSHEKEYMVVLNKPLTNSFKIAQLAAGITIDGGITKACKIIPINETTFTFILTQGLNRQIRKMVEAIGYEVKSLKRVRIMNLDLGDLKSGDWRELTEKEQKMLFDQLRNS